jgi:catechol 2,3-dioxygenase-like lactoylglutathione lyase family enzyme
LSVQSISAVTLIVADMAISVEFYREKVGLEMLYGGASASFTSFRIGEGYLNLTLQPDRTVDDVDALHQRLVQAGLTPSTKPADAPWGERYFHINDPDSHELSFAKPL